MKDILTITIAFLIIGLTLSCAGPSSKAPEKATPVLGTVKSESKAGWEMEWGQITKKGRDEGKVVIFTTWRPELRKALADAFKEKYGIEIEYIMGRGNDLAEKIIRERKAGVYYADLFIGGATTMMTILRPAGVFFPVEENLILPEVKDPGIWMDGRFPLLDKQGLIFHVTAHDAGWDVITYNSQLLKKEEIRSWTDLLNPKFKGKIVMNDPTVAGRGQQIFAVGMEFLGLDYWREFSKQQVELIRDQRLITDWVAKGKYFVSIAALNEVYNEYIRVGAPIEIALDLTDAFSYLSTASSNVALPSNPPHPNSTKTFLNWFLTKEALTIFVRESEWHSTRLDVPTDTLPPNVIRMPGKKYLNAESEEFLQKKLVYAEKAKEIFGSAIK